MAAVESALRPQERNARRRPFAWMKRLANLKNSSWSNDDGSSKKGSHGSLSAKPKMGSFRIKRAVHNNNTPYGLELKQSKSDESKEGQEEYLMTDARPKDNYPSISLQEEGQEDRLQDNRSAALTLETNPETVQSEATHSAESKAGTSNTVGGGPSDGSGRENSVFSSPNQSARSLTTTLTTIQSAAPSGLLNQGQPVTVPSSSHHQPHHQSSQPHGSTYFSHQYPTTPASAIPSHLQPQHNLANSHLPITYHSATANNLLTDNASMLTLASSSKRRHRRNSLDTNASVRAIAPSSEWGGSRESLPLSILSQGPSESFINPTPPATAVAGSAGGGIFQSQQQRPSIGGIAAAERASVYSSSGLLLSSERNSTSGLKLGAVAAPDGLAFKGGQAMEGSNARGSRGLDGGIIGNGTTGHVRNNSTTGSTRGMRLCANP